MKTPEVSRRPHRYSRPASPANGSPSMSKNRSPALGGGSSSNPPPRLPGEELVRRLPGGPLGHLQTGLLGEPLPGRPADLRGQLLGAPGGQRRDRADPGGGQRGGVVAAHRGDQRQGVLGAPALGAGGPPRAHAAVGVRVRRGAGARRHPRGGPSARQRWGRVARHGHTPQWAFGYGGTRSPSDSRARDRSRAARAYASASAYRKTSSCWSPVTTVSSSGGTPCSPASRSPYSAICSRAGTLIRRASFVSATS